MTRASFSSMDRRRASYDATLVRQAVECYYKVQTICGIPKSCIHRWVSKIGLLASRRPIRKNKKTHQTHPSNRNVQIETMLSTFIGKNPFALHTKDCKVSFSTVRRVMKRLGFTRKKANVRVVPDSKRLHERRYQYATNLLQSSIEYNNALSVDETSFDTGMFNTYGMLTFPKTPYMSTRWITNLTIGRLHCMQLQGLGRPPPFCRDVPLVCAC